MLFRSPRIDDAVLVLEERRQVAAGDVAVLVDTRCEYCSAVLAEPRRVVGTAPKERDAERSASDNHGKLKGNRFFCFRD